ncbi:Uncharacterised protein [Staphylococcus simulans]|nr:Uncharacterised protein [Staphylococcus simulans]
MAKFLYKIGTFTAKHKWLSILLNDATSRLRSSSKRT